jgi:PAS domain S-box-containing protein
MLCPDHQAILNNLSLHLPFDIDQCGGILQDNNCLGELRYRATGIVFRIHSPPIAILQCPYPALAQTSMQPEPKVNVLMVDDHPENLIALEAILAGLGQNLVKAHSGEEALRCLMQQDFAVILLDVQMPGMDGFETASLIRQRERSRDTPIIFLTAFSTNDTLKFKGYSLKAVDYLLKPIEAEVITSKVGVFVELYQKTSALKRQTLQLAAINAELRQSEERFRSLSACSPVGIILFNPEGYCTYTNPRCQMIWGFTQTEGLGQGWINFLYPEDRERALLNWELYHQNGQEYSHEYRFLTADQGMRWTHLRCSPMFSDQGQPMGHVGTIEDITERKQAEAAHANFIQEQVARQQAEAANRMKDEFLAILSHELRTPLNAMLGWTRLLLTRKLDEKTTLRALETIERNAKSQSQLIEDILNVSLIIRGKLRLNRHLIRLIPVLEAVLETLQPLADAKSIHLITDWDADVDRIFGDPERLRQVVWNLLTNAIKFTPQNGQVQISLKRVKGDAKTVTASSETSCEALVGSPECLQIQVIDTGIGIHPDFLPYVFDRFRQEDSTTTRSHGGLGLGLAIVRHLVELHDGTISVKSEGQNKGATFTVNLPVAQMENGKVTPQHLVQSPPELESEAIATPVLISSANPEDQLQEDQLQLKDVKVLVVEDNVDTREYVVMALQELGARVTAVSSVQSAMEVLEQINPNVLISDIGLPEADGYELIRKVHDLEAKRGIKIPAIALTAYAKQEEKLKVLAAGFQIHLPKPADLNELITSVATLAGRISLNSPQNLDSPQT